MTDHDDDHDDDLDDADHDLDDDHELELDLDLELDHDLDIAALRGALEAAAAPGDAAPMAAYMRGQFEFLGVKAPARRAAASPTLAAGRRATVDEVVAFVRACWDQPEREFQYVGCDLLGRNVARLEARRLADVGSLIVARSWWDTVDPLASPTVGGIVRSHPDAVGTLDDWVDGDNLWLARAAIIHQLRLGAATDVERLFGYCLRRSGDEEFFIRKAIGWALRQYARTDPDAVARFVDDHAGQLSALSRREALKRR